MSTTYDDTDQREFLAADRAERRVRQPRARRHYAHCETTGKRRFRDGKDAALELRRLSGMRSQLDLAGEAHSIRVVRRYKCDDCRGWHLTSQPKRTPHVHTLASAPRRHGLVLPIGLVPAQFRATPDAVAA